MPNRLDPESYQDFFQILEFQECREIFFRAGWNPFLHRLQGYDEETLLLFVKGLNGNIDRFGYLTFLVAKESIASATKLPKKGAHWYKHLFLLRTTHKFALRVEYQHIAGKKGFHREWIKPEYLKPLAVIIWLITCDGKYIIFKFSHLSILLKIRP